MKLLFLLFSLTALVHGVQWRITEADVLAIQKQAAILELALTSSHLTA